MEVTLVLISRGQFGKLWSCVDQGGVGQGRRAEPRCWSRAEAEVCSGEVKMGGQGAREGGWETCWWAQLALPPGTCRP